ncbi:MAG: DUF1634 domain-containing protein [Gemmatimonadales bacterium]
MSEPTHGVSDDKVEQLVGRLLQLGVLFAALVVLLGAVLLLDRSGAARPSYALFHSEPSALRSIGGIVRAAFSGDASGVVQLGLLLLILTPIARVAFTLVAFVLQRDATYVVVTAIVLALLLFGLVFGGA